MSDWKTAAEWAAAGLAGLPHTKRGMQKIADREAWCQLGPSMARQRAGRGGGWEYHVSCLPEAAQADWARRRAAAEIAIAEERDKTAVMARAAATPAEISARRRKIMEARTAIVIEVNRRTSAGLSRSHAVSALLADAAEGALPPAFMEFMSLSAERRRGKALPCRASIFDWVKAYRSGGHLALLPEIRRQEARQDHPDWLAGFIRFWSLPSKPTAADALADFSASLPDPGLAPSYDQVRRALKALQGTARHLDAFAGREGPLALKARLGFVRRTIEGMDPGTVYTADGKTFDAMVSHPMHGRPFRPEITTVVDVVTRKAVGWSVGLKENTVGVADALRHAVETHGIPAIFYTDRGAGYRNDAMDHDTLGMCARLGITTSHSLPYNSQARGVIERVNGTIWNRLAKRFPTYQGRDADREARQKVWKAIRKDLATGATSSALPSWDLFLAAVAAAVEDYNNTPHRSLRHRDPATGRTREISPAEAWAGYEAAGFAPFALTVEEADELFRPHVTRKVARGEVQWNNNHYFSQALEPFHGMDVLVGIDIHDARHVWVRRLEEVDGRIVPGALICKADFWQNKQRYFPHSFTEAATERRAKGRQRRVDLKAEEIAAEARGSLLIEHKPVIPTTLMQRPAAPAITEPAIAETFVAPAPQPAPREIHPDVAMAIEILAGREELTPGRARNIGEMIERFSGRELMELSGVDLVALRRLLRSAA